MGRADRQAMDPTTAERIAQTLRTYPLLPATAAELFVERMGRMPLERGVRFPVQMDRRRDSVAAAIRMIGLNAPMAGSIQAVLERSAMPVAGNPKHAGFHGRVQDELLEAIRGAIPGGIAPEDGAGWEEIVGLVATTLFGAPMPAARAAS